MSTGSGAKTAFKQLLVSCIFSLIILLSSCSSVKSELARAKALEDQRRWPEAIALYEHLLPRVGANNGRLLSDLYTRLGHCFLESEHPEESLAALSKATALNPTNNEAHTYLVELYITAGALERLDSEVKYLNQHHSNDPKMLAALGAIYFAQGKMQAAENVLLQAFRLDPRNDRVAESLAELYSRDEDMNKAREILREAFANSHAPAPLLYLARLEEEQGNSEAAEASYRQAVLAQDNVETNLRLAQFLQRVSKLKEAREVLSKVDRMLPQAPFSVADMDLNTGHWENALQGYQIAFDRLLEQSPLFESRADGWQSTAGARIIEADIQAASRQFKSKAAPQEAFALAHAHLSEFGSALDPVTLAVLRGELALAEGDQVQARQQAELVLQRGESVPSAHYLLGAVEYQQGKIKEAVSEWETALGQDPNYVPAKLALANVEFQQHQIEQAEDHVMDVVREEPVNLDALILYTRVLRTQHHYDSARFIALRAMVANGSSAEPHIALGEIALAQNHFAEALLEFEKAALIDPRSPVAINGLTAVYRHGTITKSMLRKMEMTASNPPASATLMELAGRLYADHGWYNDAERCFQRALEVDNTRTTSLEALAKTYLAESRYGNQVPDTSRLLEQAAPGHTSGNLLAGLKAEQQADSNAAIQNYENALGKGGSTGVAANNLAWIYARQGVKLDHALALAQQAFSANPLNPAVLDTLGYVLLKRREYSQAVEVLRKASELLARTPAGPQEREVSAAIEEHLKEACLRSGQPEIVTRASNEDALRTGLAREHRKGE